jgi:hypothetical protein
LAPITAIAANSSLTVTGAADGSVALWRGFDREETLFAHAGAVVALAIGAALGIVVSAGREGAVVIAMLPGLVCLRKINAAMRQIAVIGASVVGCGETGALRSVGVNGDCSDDAEFDGPAVDLCPVEPRGGGAFVAVVGKDGKVSVHTAVGLRTVSTVAKHAVAVRWRRELGVIAAVGEDRAVVMYPFGGV